MRCGICALDFDSKQLYRAHVELESDAAVPLDRYTSPELNEEWEEWVERRDMTGEARHFVPDRSLYVKVVEEIRPADSILDVGAGDLRLDLALAERARKVYAVEVDPLLLGRALEVVGYRLPANLVPICADGFDLPPPREVTVVMALIRKRDEAFPPSWRDKKVIYDEDGELVIEDPLSE